jgi:hypothetical protein
MTRRTLFTVRLCQDVAEQAGFILMQHLLADGPLPDELDLALWYENDAGVLAWLARELPEIAEAVHPRCRREFLRGAYQRYFDDYAEPRRAPAPAPPPPPPPPGVAERVDALLKDMEAKT